MGEGQGEGLAVPIHLHEEDRTVTLTPALSHPMGEGDPQVSLKTHLQVEPRAPFIGTRRVAVY